MHSPEPEQIQHLENAFQAFNHMSEQLMESYRQLEGQVGQLNQELDQSHKLRQRQDEASQLLAARLHHVFDVLPGGVVVLDGNGIVSECNPAAIELLGEPLKGIPWRNVINRAFSPRYDDGHEVSLHDGRRVSIDTSSLNTEPGQILLLKDVTETRHLQDKLSRYQRLTSMGYMAASLAHQIRTPLSSALLYTSQLTGGGASDAVVKKCAVKTREQLKYIESMIGDMLLYTKGDSETGSDSFDLSLLFDRLEAAMQGQLAAKSGTLVINNQLGHQRIRANSDALLSAILNIANNGLQACTDTPEIEVSASRLDAHTLLITIQDNGSGIPKDIRNRLFDPFFTTRTAGTGLGLAVVSSIIDKHDGTIDFETIEGRGTVFKLQLPVLDEPSVDSSSLDRKNDEVMS